MKMVKRIIRIGAWSVALAICVGWTIGCTQNKQHSKTLVTGERLAKWKKADSPTSFLIRCGTFCVR